MTESSGTVVRDGTMATIDELPLKYRVFVKTYPWRRVAPIPFVSLRKPVAEARLALVTSGGLSVPGDPPFDETIRGGDWSYRIIPNDADLSTLVESHRSDAFDHDGIALDRNLAIPTERLSELADAGIVGSVAPRHLSFMGSLTAPGRLVKIAAPEAAEILVDDGVDAALLVPV